MNFYNGTIEKMVIVGGPAACGKSTLCERPLDFIEPCQLPDALSGLPTRGPEHADIVGLRNRREPYFRELYLHVDILRPFMHRLSTVRFPSTRSEYLDLIRSDLYTDWELFQRHCATARSLNFLTLFIDRETHFQRWIYSRAAGENNQSTIATPALMYYGDSVNKSEIHRRLYQAWSNTIQDLQPASAHVLDVSSKPYRFIPDAEYQVLLNEGY